MSDAPFRPVEASPPQLNQRLVDPATGMLTLYGHRQFLDLWKRTGGFTDDIGALIGLVGLSQATSLAAAGNEERTRRVLGDALAQVQAQNAERLRSEFDAYRRQAETQFGQLLGSLARPPQTRAITFAASDTWRLNPDVRAVQVIAVGGGGGGGGGKVFATIQATGGGGGGGAAYSYGHLDASRLPEEVTITVGAGGAGGAGDANGSTGGTSSFGDLIVAIGGSGGLAGNGGASAAGGAATTYGGLFMGGAGGAGRSNSGDDADNLLPGAPGGGGGGGSDGGAGGDGGTGSWRSALSAGGGGSGGAVGADGAAGNPPTDSDRFFAPGFGGGGGGGATALGGDGGAGGAGVNGGGGGGGGGSNDAGIAGVGGNGGDGRVWIVEYY